MARTGRPTPQASTGERPRFRDVSSEEREESPRFDSVNPHLRAHRAWGDELLPASEAWRHHGAWASLFGREAPLHVEIGSGNGFFLRDLSLRHPEWNVLGIEIRYKRVMICAKKLREAGVKNARIARYHAAYLDDLFEPGTLSGLYVNHPDPWPKERHEKNRLISRWFLEDVVRLLKPGAWFRLKSDHRPNVDRVLELLDKGPDGEPLPRLPLEVIGVSEDIERDGAPWPDDIKTNYQRKFIQRGLPVYGIEVRRTDAPWPPP